MEQQKFDALVEALHVHDSIEDVYIFSKEVEVGNRNSDFPLSNEDAKAMLNAWKSKEQALTFQGHRFAILKNDEIQLAAKNIGAGKGNIIGSINREGEYLIAHTRDEDLILLEWSIFINKVAWS